MLDFPSLLPQTLNLFMNTNRLSFPTVALIGFTIFIAAILGIGAASPSTPVPVEISIKWDAPSSRLDWGRYEYGLRSDGVIVWREKAKR